MYCTSQAKAMRRLRREQWLGSFRNAETKYSIAALNAANWRERQLLDNAASASMIGTSSGEIRIHWFGVHHYPQHSNLLKPHTVNQQTEVSWFGAFTEPDAHDVMAIGLEI